MICAEFMHRMHCLSPLFCLLSKISPHFPVQSPELFLLALHANKTPGFLSKFWVTPVWQGLVCFLAKAVIIGNLPVVIPSSKGIPLQHLLSLVTLCCLWTAAFYILFRIYSCYVHKDYQQPIPFLWACVYLMFFLFSSVFITFSPPQPAPGVSSFWCPEFHSLFWK